MGNTYIEGRVARVSKPAEYTYMLFADLTNFTRAIQEDDIRRYDLKSDTDTITANISGLRIGLEVAERTPFSQINYRQANGTPITFSLIVRFETLSPGISEYQFIFDAEVPAIYKIMIGEKLREMVDKMTDKIECSINAG